MKTVEKYYPHRTRQQSIKAVLMALILSILAYASFAQSADGYIQIHYMGKVNGIHKVQVKNLQNCAVDLAFYWDGKNIPPANSNGQIAASATKVFDFTGDANLIKVKALTVCNWRGNHPAWLILDYASLPVKFKKVTVTVIKN